jgi:Na+-transporting NADH:ubiquinone oxidoreductase subunit C
MVIVVAAFLSTAALLLKPAQERNVAIAKMQGILSAANVEATADNAIDLYDKYIVREKVIDPSGELVSVYSDGKFEKGDVRAFEIKLKEQFYKKNTGQDYILPLYEAEKDGETIYIIPMEGKGLWGPIYGNLALKDDFNTVAGATFSHKAETPGLGAEIDQTFFEEQFIGKKIFDEQENFTSIQVVKGGAQTLPESKQIHGVDAISGGTITSNGVTDMLQDNLESYVAYFKKQTKE